MNTTNRLSRGYAENLFIPGIEGAQKAARASRQFLDYAKNPRLGCAAVELHVRRATGSRAERDKDTFAKARRSLEEYRRIAPLWVQQRVDRHVFH